MNASIKTLGSEGVARRISFAFVAFGGSAAYAASFYLVKEAVAFRSLGLAIAVAAAVSWPAFGASLWATTRFRPSLVAWVDLCLATMAIGIAVLGISIMVNLAGFWHPVVHYAVLVGSDASMAVRFVLGARRLGLAPLPALALWVIVLNGTFALLVAVLR